jgi:hypothetical protein
LRMLCGRTLSYFGNLESAISKACKSPLDTVTY